MEVPWLEVQSELYPLAYATATTTRDQSASATYTTALGNARSSTHGARPGIEPSTLWFLVRFVNHSATTGTPGNIFFFFLISKSIILQSATNQHTILKHSSRVWLFLDKATSLSLHTSRKGGSCRKPRLGLLPGTGLASHCLSHIPAELRARAGFFELS